MKGRDLFVDSDKERLISCLANLAESEEYVFRGYGKQDELYPSIVRNNLEDVEHALLSDFEKYGSHYFHASNPVDFISYAQHFGLSTRLLDFTSNPFIALHFALFMPKSPGKYKEDEDKDFYYIRYARKTDNIYYNELPIELSYQCFDGQLQTGGNYLDKSQKIYKPNMGYSLSAQARCLVYEIERHRKGVRTPTLEGSLVNGIQQGRLLFVDPNQSNQRIIMQQGLFLLPYTLEKKEHMKLLNENTSLIMISKGLRGVMQKYLNSIGVNSFRLMPDLQNICEAIVRKVKEERSKSDE